MRAQAKINSPKGRNGMNFQDDGAGNGASMSLNLSNVDDENNEYEDDKITPNTKRDQMDVNSPRKEKQVYIHYNYIHINIYML